METNSPAEELPELYRAILDRVARMEAIGERAEAARLRSDATKAYSRAWDEKARRRLQQLLHRGELPVATGRTSAGHERRLGAQSAAQRVADSGH
jgi:L-alanine-DL-glutamate epimerase-like enolase superfamily enzyme